MGGTLLDDFVTSDSDNNDVSNTVASDLFVSDDRGRSWSRLGSGLYPGGLADTGNLEENFYDLSSENATSDNVASEVATRTTFSMVAWEAKDMLLVFAGINNEGILLNDIWTGRPSEENGVDWYALTGPEGASWEARHSPGHIIFREQLWLVGGCTAKGCLSDVWSWDGDESGIWTLVEKSARWTGRRSHGVAALTDRMLIFGGTRLPDKVCAECIGNTEIEASMALLNDVWASADGIDWIELTPTAGWSPRSGFGVAILEDSVWLFGGTSVEDGEEIVTNDVYCSRDGDDWFTVAENNKNPGNDYWTPRSGLAVVTDAIQVGVTTTVVYLIGGAAPSDVWAALATDNCLSAQANTPVNPGCYGCDLSTLDLSLYISFGVVGGCFMGLGFYVLLVRQKKDERSSRRGSGNKGGMPGERNRRRRKNTRRSTFRSDKFGENGYDRRLMDEDYASSTAMGFSFISTASSKLSKGGWKNSLSNSSKSNVQSGNGARNSLDSSISTATSSTTILDNNDFLINFASLDIDRMIGCGSQGQVYTGRYAATPVAIKHYAGYMALRKHNSAQAEIEAKMLSRLHHPNVIRLYGICINSDECYLVMELGVQSLAEFIQSGNATVISNEVKRKILLQVASGMSFLHSKGMIHRDLKPENVILDGDLNAKICDFACSRFAETSPHENMTADVGTHIYMAPELFGRMDQESHDNEPFLYTSKVDVYSFGMCVYALETGRHPFQKEQEEGQFGFLDLLNLITSGLRPALPGKNSFDSTSSSSEFEGLMTTCWAEDPSDRPLFQDITLFLESMDGSSSCISLSSFMNKLPNIRETEVEDDDDPKYLISVIDAIDHSNPQAGAPKTPAPSVMNVNDLV